MAHFIDESFRPSVPVYVVASVQVDAHHAARLRYDIKGLLPPRAGRFHWRNESEASRFRMLEVLTGSEAIAEVYVCTATQKQERSRTQCIELMLWDLMTGDAPELVFESRQEHNDRRDRSKILNSQKRGAAPELLRYSFELPHREPLLWLADAAAGAVSASYAGDGRYVARLGASVLVKEVGL